MLPMHVPISISILCGRTALNFGGSFFSCDTSEGAICGGQCSEGVIVREDRTLNPYCLIQQRLAKPPGREGEVIW